MVQGIVGRVEEDNRSTSKKCYPQIVSHAFIDRTPQQIAHKEDTHGELHPIEVEGNDKDGEEQEHEGDTQTGEQAMHGLTPVVTVDTHHHRQTQLDEQHHNEIAYRRRRIK